MRILELFSGTCSFSKVAEERGHEVFTVDILEKFNPSLCKNVLDLEKEDIPFIPDVIWASPPCTEYSKAKSSGVRNIEEANRIVAKTKQIIEELNPKIWFIENPQTGLLKKQPILNTIYSQMPYKDVSYCKYGMPYRKQTRIWTNLNIWQPRPLCKRDCESIIKTGKRKRHMGSAGCGGKGQKHKISYSDKPYQVQDKYQIPKELCLEIIKCCENKLRGN